jgi:hypothetical protein
MGPIVARRIGRKLKIKPHSDHTSLDRAALGFSRLRLGEKARRHECESFFGIFFRFRDENDPLWRLPV